MALFLLSTFLRFVLSLLFSSPLDFLSLYGARGCSYGDPAPPNPPQPLLMLLSSSPPVPPHPPPTRASAPRPCAVSRGPPEIPPHPTAAPTIPIARTTTLPMQLAPPLKMSRLTPSSSLHLHTTFPSLSDNLHVIIRDWLDITQDSSLLHLTQASPAWAWFVLARCASVLQFLVGLHSQWHLSPSHHLVHLYFLFVFLRGLSFYDEMFHNKFKWGIYYGPTTFTWNDWFEGHVLWALFQN